LKVDEPIDSGAEPKKNWGTLYIRKRQAIASLNEMRKVSFSGEKSIFDLIQQ